MTIHSLLTPVEISLDSYIHRFPTAVTVMQSESELVVIDTGFPESDLAVQFHEIGLDPLDVDLVVNTHYHVDHFGGNWLFPKARKLVSRHEYQFQHRWHDAYLSSRDRRGFVMRSFPRLSRRDGEKLVRFLDVVQTRFFSDEHFGPMDRAVYLEDDPKMPDWLEIMHTPGHSPHHLSCRVEGVNASAVVTGDIIAGRSGFMNGRLNFIEVYTDYEAAQASIARIREKTAQGRSLIYPSHEGPFLARDGSPLTDNPFTLDIHHR
jgi:glyoxylase-like metal-dependent hydrolase (beta-lactamase superfamily II)